ncbi:MAG: IPT/TIG domain-containing protein [Candidatus Magasanikbacteria bacterium]
MNFFKNKNSKFFLAGLLLAIVFVGIATVPALAQNTTDTLGVNTVGKDIALGGADLRVTVVKIINTVLGLLGIIAVGIVLYGGFVYMTAGGEDDKISTAKKIIINGVIGLAIILSAFAITKFVLNKLSEATGLKYSEVDTSLDGDCSDPNSDYFIANASFCNPFQVCQAKHFFVQSITPNTKGDDVVGMNNVIVRAVFSQPVGSNVSDAIKIEKDNIDVTNDFALSFVENNYVIEAMPKSHSGCDEVMGEHCVSKGNYKISVLEVKDQNGNDLEVVTDCGTYPKDASFVVGDEKNVIDTKSPTLSGFTLNNQTYEDENGNIHLVAGNLYPVTVSTNDRVSPIVFGGNSFVVLNIYKEGSISNILKTYVNAPPISLGSSASFSFNYSYRVPTNLEPNTTYVLEVVGHDIDSNVTRNIIKFSVVPASCSNEIQDDNETGVDTGGVCGGGLGDPCTQQSDCSTSYKCLDTKDNLCASTNDCICKKWPYIESVEKNNGAPGNWITISGRNFGNTPGKVAFNYFNGDGTFISSSTVSLAECRGSNVWNNNWIIVEVPAKPVGILANNDPVISVRNLELLSASSNPTSTTKFVDFTNDDFGTNSSTLAGFTYNDIKRPGLCSVETTDSSKATSAVPDTSVVAKGKAFGNFSAQSKFVFGRVEASVRNSNWSDTAVTSTVPFANFGKNSVYIESNNEQSNPVWFTILKNDSNVLPIITSISPATTTIGSYVTITGKNFGWEPGEVTIGNHVTASLPDFCGTGWKDTQIIVKVANSTPIATNQVVVRRTDVNKSSTADNFINIVSGSPMPSICKIEPAIGPAPLIDSDYLILKGENFISFSPKFYFWTKDSLENNYTNWLTTNNFDNVQIPSGEEAKVTIPVDNLTGLSMFSGPIVIKANNQYSNGINYEVEDCRLAGQTKPDGFQCCQIGPEAGVLKRSSMACEGVPRDAGYAWRFTTGRIPETFEVLEQCKPFDVSVVPSPTPWDARDTGKIACVNAQIQATFSLPINPTEDTSYNYKNNIHVFTCGTGASSTDCTGDVTSNFGISISGNDTLVFKPNNTSGNLQPNTWYKVALSGNLESRKNVLGLQDYKIEKLTATKTCTIGSNSYAYCFSFKTGNANDLCKLVDAGINPPSATTIILGIVQDISWPLTTDLSRILTENQNIHPQYFDVYGISNQQCIAMNVDKEDWQWGPVQHTNTLTATAKKNSNPKYQDLNSRGVATAWQNNPAGSDIFAKLLNLNGKVVSTTYDLLSEFGVNPNYQITSSSESLSKDDPTNKYSLFGDFKLYTEVSLDDLSLSDYSPTDESLLVYERRRYVLKKENEYFLNFSEIVTQFLGRLRILEFHYGDDINFGVAVPISQTNFNIEISRVDSQVKLKINGVVKATQSSSAQIKSDGRLFLGNFGNSEINNFNLLSGRINKLELTNIDSNYQQITATSTIKIDLENPAVINKWPSCTEACVNAEIGAQFNQIMVTSTYYSDGDGQIHLYRCSNEKCLPTFVEDVSFDVSILSDEQTFRIYSQNNLATSTWYLVEIPNNSIYAIGGLSNASQITQGKPVSVTQWKFKTKASDEPCLVANADVVPDPFFAYYVGQKTPYKVLARSAIDSCNPNGQALNSWDYGWDWSVQDANIANVTHFSISGKSNNFCTQSCIPAGSDIARSITAPSSYALCGNGGMPDLGEDCDINISGEQAGVSCTYDCLRPGNKHATSSIVYSNNVLQNNRECGDGFVSPQDGEQCDPNDPNLKKTINGVVVDYSKYCSSICLWTGSNSEQTGDLAKPICGSGDVTPGEACDGGNGCSNFCLNIGTKLSQEWCDGILDKDSVREICQNAVSVCGNNVIESGEECEVGLSGATVNTCSSSCLLQNVCDPSLNLKQCNKGTEGCNDDCTLAGSSLLYSSPSICGDGVTGVGEYSSSQSSCEMSVAIGSNPLGGSPVQMVTSQGNPPPKSGETMEIVEKLTTKIFAKPVNYYKNNAVTPISANSVQGEGEYNLMCGYTEYSEIKDSSYNNCPNNATNSLGVSSNSCCYLRSTRSEQYPAVNADAVCRNTYLEVGFATQMDKLSFTDNVSIIEGYEQSGYKCEDHGQTTVTDEINKYLSINTESSPVGFWQNIWSHVKSFFADLFAGRVFAANPEPNNSLSGRNIVWCATNKTLQPIINYVYDNQGKITNTTASFSLPDLLDPNVYVLVLMKGGTKGIKDINGVSIRNHYSKSTTSSFYENDDSWLFKTGSEVCKIGEITVTPESYLFSSKNIVKDFSIKIVSNSGGQLISPIPNVYDWSYSWQPAQNDIFNIPNTNSSTINITPKGVEGSVDALAHVEVTADIDTENSQQGQGFSKLFKLQALFCSNPWPATTTNVSGNVDHGASFGMGFADTKFNFSFLYCADNNNPLTKIDDLPLFDNVILSNNSDEYGIGDLALRSYFLFSSSTEDAIGVQVFENVPNDDGTPRSLEDWYIGKFKNLGSMKPASVAGYNALTDGTNYYVSVFDVDRSLDDTTGVIYNYIILFSSNENASQDTTKVFGQIINNLQFNTGMTEHNKCLSSNYTDPIIIRSNVNHDISDQNCNNDFDCRDNSGLPLVGTSGYCSNEKTKFYRDLSRLNSLRVTQYNLDNYFTSYFGKPEFVGGLKSGSFIPGYTNSKWQNSWGLLNSYAGTVAVDPVNLWAGCTDHDPLTCWNAVSSTYACPQFAEVYEYKFVSSTQSYNIYAPFEYLLSDHDASFVNRYINKNKNKIIFGRYCTPDTILSNASGSSSCGDGVISPSSGEECEPPNSTKFFTYDRSGLSCDAGERATGTCNPISCTWDIANSCTPIVGSCGDGIKQVSETCDDGSFNGRYGYCNADCLGSGAYCGDGNQDTNEYCDKNQANYQNGFCSGDKTLSCSVNNDCVKQLPSYCEITKELVFYCKVDRGSSPRCLVGNNGSECSGLTYTGADNRPCLSVNDPTYDFQKVNSCSFSCNAPGGYCGDGITQWTYEQCDDANLIDNDACKNDCTLPASDVGSICGNNLVESGEQCDDQNVINGDGCSSNCQTETTAPYCGDGLVNLFDDKNKDSVKQDSENWLEQCDLGAEKNGIKCNPTYGNSCTYCNTSCAIETIEAPQRCGNGVVDKDINNNWLEACDYKLTNGVQTTVTTYREQDVGNVTCEPEQKGSYQCTNNCQLLQNNCVSCGLGTNLPLPKLGIINPMVTGGNAKYTDQPHVTLYKGMKDGSFTSMATAAFGNYFFDTWRKVNYSGEYFQNNTQVSYTLLGSSLQNPLITDGNYVVSSTSILGLETNSQCTYKLFFNTFFVSSTLTTPGDVDQKVDAGLGSLFDYPVNNEVGVVTNEVIMSPAVPPGYIRVVIRSKKNSNINFMGNFYSDSVDSVVSTSFRYSDIQSVNGFWNYMGDGGVNSFGGTHDTTKNSSVMDEYVYPNVAFNGFAYRDNLLRASFHPLINTDYSGTQAITFNSTNSTNFTSSTLGFYVSSPSGQMDFLKDSNDVWVEVYHYHNNQVPVFSIYKPDFVFKLSNAKPSESGSANYWHVFNIHIDSSNIVVLPVDSNTIPARPIDYLQYMESNPFATITYDGSIVTGTCGVRAGMPNTTKCQYYQ